MPTASFFQTISSFLYTSQMSPWPSEAENTLFAHHACWQSNFSLTSSVCLWDAEAAFWVFFAAGPSGEGRAVALLVTSDTAQPLPANQMEIKCKWETAGWQSGQDADRPGGCLRPGLHAA